MIKDLKREQSGQLVIDDYPTIRNSLRSLIDNLGGTGDKRYTKLIRDTARFDSISVRIASVKALVQLDEQDARQAGLQLIDDLNKFAPNENAANKQYIEEYLENSRCYVSTLLGLLGDAELDELFHARLNDPNWQNEAISFLSTAVARQPTDILRAIIEVNDDQRNDPVRIERRFTFKNKRQGHFFT